MGGLQSLFQSKEEDTEDARPPPVCPPDPTGPELDTSVELETAEDEDHPGLPIAEWAFLLDDAHAPPLEVHEDRKMGAGGFGAVYHATFAGRPVAAKTWLAFENPASIRNESELDGLLRECTREFCALAELCHPHIIEFAGVAYGDWKGHLLPKYILMAVADGGSLYGRIHHCPGPSILECPGLLEQYAAQIASGLAFMHSKDYLHRDIKPDNVLLHGGSVKLGDLGMSKLIQRYGRSHTICGTPGYDAPEVNSGMYGPAVDVYALGYVMLEMIVSEMPATRPSGRKKQLEAARVKRPDLATLLKRCTSKNPEKRPSAREVCSQMEARTAEVPHDVSLPALADMMQRQQEVVACQIGGCRRLLALSEMDPEGVVAVGGPMLVVDALKTHGGSSSVLSVALEALAVMCKSDSVVAHLPADVPAVVVGILRDSADADLIEHACAGLAALASASCEDATVDAGGVQAVVAALLRHSTHPGCQQRGCEALLNLCNKREIQDKIAEVGGIAAAISCMSTPGQPACAAASLELLGRISAGNDANKISITAEGGLEGILAVLRRPDTTAAVLRSVCDILCEIGSIEESRARLWSLDVRDALRAAGERHQGNAALQERLEATLAKLMKIKRNFTMSTHELALANANVSRASVVHCISDDDASLPSVVDLTIPSPATSSRPRKRAREDDDEVESERKRTRKGPSPCL